MLIKMLSLISPNAAPGSRSAHAVGIWASAGNPADRRRRERSSRARTSPCRRETGAAIIGRVSAASDVRLSHRLETNFVRPQAGATFADPRALPPCRKRRDSRGRGKMAGRLFASGKYNPSRKKHDSHFDVAKLGRSVAEPFPALLGDVFRSRF